MQLSNARLPILLLTLAALFYNSCTALQKAGYPSSSRSGSSTLKSANHSGNEAMLRRNIARYAENYKGVRYKYAGKDPKGFDCSGFTCYVMDKFAIQLSPSSGTQANQGKRVSVKEAKTGDLVFFSKSGRGKPSHVALVVDNSKEGLIVIHSTTSRGVIQENVSQSSYWKPKMLFARNVLD